ncbi:hypothetical protein NBRC116583_07940 [Arenicella sp. 4NH20-0111]|uniref:hypothetical protein n=1 Tax=Arenicella sp. 4NH20-0111 TaxID=3127648 RepID=UPI0031035AC8
MKDLGIFFIKVSVFAFIGAGASIASIGIPLMDYGKESRVLIYEVEEKIGKRPNEEVCIPELAKDYLGKCKTAVYMDAVLNDSMKKLTYWLFYSTLLGIICFLIGAIIYIKAILNDRRAQIESDKTI